MTTDTPASPPRNKGGRPKGSSREKLAQRDREMWDYCQQGMSHTDIAKTMKLSIGVVDKSIERIFQTYRAEMTGKVEARVGMLIAQYEYIVTENFQAWRNSKSPNKRVSKTNMRRLKAESGKSKGDGDTSDTGELESTSVASSDVEPDTRYFETAMKAMKEIRGLLGSVTTPQQVQLTGADGGPIRIQNELDFSGFGTAQMAAYLQEMAKVAMSMGEQAIKSLPLDSESDAPTIIQHEPTVSAVVSDTSDKV